MQGSKCHLAPSSPAGFRKCCLLSTELSTESIQLPAVLLLRTPCGTPSLGDLPCGDAAVPFSPCTVPLPACSSVFLHQDLAPFEVRFISILPGLEAEIKAFFPKTLCAVMGCTVQHQGAVLQAMPVPAIAWQANSPSAAMSHVAPPAHCTAQLLNCLEITPSSLLMSSLQTCCPRLVRRAVPTCTKLAHSKMGALMQSSEPLSNPFSLLPNPVAPQHRTGQQWDAAVQPLCW